MSPLRSRLAGMLAKQTPESDTRPVGQGGDETHGEPAAVVDAAAPVHRLETGQNLTSRSAPQARVMIVDDHQLVRDAVRKALSGSGIEVVAEASSAQEALDQALAARPDLVLLDIDLRGATGTEIVPELKRRLPNARIVMLTVSATDEDVDAAIRAGASGYLTKNMSSDALVRAVRGALSGDLAMSRRMAQQLVDRMSGSSGEAHDKSALEVLTPRERDVLRLLSEGLTAREIGESLVLSSRTIEGHVGAILRKLGVRNRVEAVRVYRGN